MGVGLTSNGSEEAFKTCEHLWWGPGAPGDAEQRVSGGASPAVSPRARESRGALNCTPSPARLSCPRPHEPPAGGERGRKRLRGLGRPKESQGPESLKSAAREASRPHPGCEARRRARQKEPVIQHLSATPS